MSEPSADPGPTTSGEGDAGAGTGSPGSGTPRDPGSGPAGGGFRNGSVAERVLGSPAAPIPEGGFALRVLRTRGRRTGQTRSTPLGVVRRDGLLFLVCPQGDRDWLRNLRSDPECETAAGDEVARHRAVTTSGPEAAGAVAAYLRTVPEPVQRQFPVPPDASDADIAARLDVMTVLRLDPR